MARAIFVCGEWFMIDLDLGLTTPYAQQLWATRICMMEQNLFSFTLYEGHIDDHQIS